MEAFNLVERSITKAEEAIDRLVQKLAGGPVEASSHFNSEEAASL